MKNKNHTSKIEQKRLLVNIATYFYLRYPNSFLVEVVKEQI